MIYSILFWFILTIPTNSQRSDCVSVCSHIEDDRAYGKCISDCGKSPRKDNVPEPVYYPQPPANVSVQTKVVIDNGKILETTVAWTAQPGT
ncbi:hypothetical protein WR25_10750 [Diploscapter pachys]|uniref:Uncharacterized protein n=1 Tax=Diploscapter pachys TaxID=2018661 RepID=A0A2A2JBS2_9BILA|nr:hypothetical protein WR25_10750 [Diploscapter pachys]